MQRLHRLIVTGLIVGGLFALGIGRGAFGWSLVTLYALLHALGASVFRRQLLTSRRAILAGHATIAFFSLSTAYVAGYVWRAESTLEAKRAAASAADSGARTSTTH